MIALVERIEKEADLRIAAVGDSVMALVVLLLVLALVMIHEFQKQTCVHQLESSLVVHPESISFYEPNNSLHLPHMHSYLRYTSPHCLQ